MVKCKHPDHKRKSTIPSNLSFTHVLIQTLGPSKLGWAEMANPDPNYQLGFTKRNKNVQLKMIFFLMVTFIKIRTQRDIVN